MRSQHRPELSGRRFDFTERTIDAGAVDQWGETAGAKLRLIPRF
jgi:hypothetical protein